MIEVGDVVVRLTGGESMTVYALKPSGSTTIAEVVWMTGDRKNVEFFDVRHLRLASKA